MNHALKRLKFILPLLAVLATSCGEENPGGGTGTFDTVSVLATAGTNRLEADIVTGNTCAADVSSGGSIITESIPVTITSTPVPNSKVVPKKVFIDSVTVSYAPNLSASTPGTTPMPLPDFIQTGIGQALTPGGSLSISVPVLSDSHKVLLRTNNFPVCSSRIWSYYVTITFQGVEENGTGASFYTTMNLAIADRT